jgi:hypothetical protein
LSKTIGIDVVTAFAANAEAGLPAARMSDTWRPAKSAASGQLLDLICCPAIFDRNIATFDITRFTQT